MIGAGSAANAGTLNVRLTSNTSQMVKGFQGAMRSVTNLTKSLQMASLAGAASFASFAAIGRGILKAGGEFERGMVRAGAVAQATNAEMKDMRKSALSLSSATEFTARQVAEAFGNMAQRGLDVNKIMGAAPGVLQLASAAQMGVADAASIATNVLNAYKLEAKDLTRVNDALTAASSNAAIDVHGIGEAFKYVGAVGASFRIDLEEMTSALGLLGSVGIPAEMAGTSLKKIIPAVSAARNATGKTRKIFDELGLSALSMATDGFPALVDIVRVVEDRIKATGDEALVSAQLMEVFGQRAGPALVALAGAGSKAMEDLTAKIKASGGIAEEISRKQLNTFQGRMAILESQIEKLAISLSDSLIPVVTKLGGAISGAVGYFDALPQSTKKIIVEFGAVATAILGLMVGFSALTMVLSPLTAIFGLVGRTILLAFSGPVLAAAASIAGLVLIVGALRKAWDANLFGMADAFDPVLDGVKSLIAEFRSLMTMMGKIPSAKQLEDTLREKAGLVTSTNAEGAQIFTKERNVGIKPAARGAIYDFVETLAPELRDRLQLSLGQLLADDVGVGSSVKASAGQDLQASGLGSYRSPGEVSIKMVSPGGDEAAPFVAPGSGGADSALRDAAKTTMDDVVGTFGSGLEVIKEKFGAVIDFAAEKIDSDALQALAGQVTNATSEFKAFVAAMKSGSLMGAGGKAPGSFSAPSGPIMGGGSVRATQLRSAAKPMVQAFEEALKKGFGPLIDELGFIGDQFNGLGKELKSAFSSGGRLGILPSITRGDKGEVTGGDPGSLLGGSKIGGTVAAGMQGAAVGGPIGALVAVLAEILIGAEDFQRNLEFGGDTLSLVGDALAAFAEPMRAIHGQMRKLIDVAMKPVAALMKNLGSAFQVFAPILKLLTLLFEAVNVILEPFIDVIKIIGEMLMIVVQAFVVVFRPIILVILAIVRGLAAVWNAIVGAIAWIFDKIADVFGIIGLGGPARKLADWMRSLQINTEGLDGAMKTLAGSIVDDPFGKDFVDGSIQEGMDEFGDNLADVNEELTNIPSGFKIALERFRSTMGGASGIGSSTSGLSSTGAGMTIPAMASGGVALGPTLALIGERGDEAVVPLDRLAAMIGGGGGGGINIENMQVMADDPVSLFQQIERESLRRRQLETGVGIAGGAQYVGG